MKKWIWLGLGICVVVILLLCVWEQKSLEITYEIQSAEFAPGEEVTVNVSAQNVGRSFQYQGVGSFSALLFIDVDGERYYIYPEDKALPEPAGTYIWKNGEVHTQHYTFAMPEDAPRGQYSLHVWYEGEEKVFEGIAEIL